MKTRRVEVTTWKPAVGDVVQVCVLAPIPGLTLCRWVEARVSMVDDSGFSAVMLEVQHATQWRYWRAEGKTWRRFDPSLEKCCVFKGCIGLPAAPCPCVCHGGLERLCPAEVI